MFRLLFIFYISVNCVNAITPSPDHVVVVMLENHSYEQIFGSAAAPYLNGLISDSKAALFTQSFGVSHPSQPNYLQIYSGSNQGVTDNLLPAGIPFTTANLGASLIAASKTFVGYSQGLPSVGYTGAASGAYVRKHNPWVNWQGTGPNGVPSTTNQPFTSFPTNYNLLPTVSFVVPDLNYGMHDGTDPGRITLGDTWIQNNLNSYIQWAKLNNSLIVITFDEDDLLSNQHIYTLFIGQMVQGGSYSNHIDHYNILRMLEDMYSLPHAGAAATSTPIDYCWIQCSQPAIINASGPLSFCQGSSVSLTASAGNSYMWSNGSSNSSIVVSTSGDYSVTITDGIGCSATSAVKSVTVNNFSVSSVLFTESMGTVSVNSSIATHESANSFDNDNLTMTGTADVRASSPSSGYTGSTAAGNIFFTNTSGINFNISGINTSLHSNLKLSFGISKSTTASTGSDFSIQVSTDGTNYTNLTMPALTAGISGWSYKTLSGNIPSTANLRIRFTQNGTTTQYRIDDLKLEYSITTPVISAGGTTSFCQGGSVVLSATTANSYSWTNGVTTQNITAVSSGNYFVVETSSNGCTATSNVIPVSVTLLPLVSGFSPTQAFGGTSVVISGSNFTGVTAVKFNGTNSSFTINNSSQITAIVPPSATSGTISITAPCGTGTSSSSFTVFHGDINLMVKLYVQGFYKGNGEMISIFGAGMCDTVTLELHSPTTPFNTLFTSKAAINVVGYGIFTFPDVVNGNSYYFVVHGRNALKTWSSSAVTIGTNTLYDFTNAASKAFGSNLANLNDGNYALFSGDVSQDGAIDLIDFNLVKNAVQNFQTGYNKHDLTGDNIVESSDLGLVENNMIPVNTLHP